MNFSTFSMLLILGLATIVFCSESTTTAPSTVDSSNSTVDSSNSTGGFMSRFAAGFFNIVASQSQKTVIHSTRNLSIETKFTCNDIKPWCLMCIFQTRRKDHPKTKAVDIGSTLMKCSKYKEIDISEHFEYNEPTAPFVKNMVVIHSCTDDGAFLKLYTEIPENESSKNFLNGLSLSNFGQGLVETKKQRG